MRAFMKLASAEPIASRTVSKTRGVRAVPAAAEFEPATADSHNEPDFLEFPQPSGSNRAAKENATPLADKGQQGTAKPNAGMPKISTDFCEDLRGVGAAVRVPSYIREISARIRSGTEGSAGAFVPAGSTGVAGARAMDPALWRVVQAWPRLSSKLRKTILGLIEPTDRGRPSRPATPQKPSESLATQALATNRCKSAGARPKRAPRDRRSGSE